MTLMGVMAEVHDIYIVYSQFSIYCLNDVDDV